MQTNVSVQGFPIKSPGPLPLGTLLSTPLQMILVPLAHITLVTHPSAPFLCSTGYDKKAASYLRCNKVFSHATNHETSCRYHEIGLFDRVGPGNWWNCCKSYVLLSRNTFSSSLQLGLLRRNPAQPRQPQQCVLALLAVPFLLQRRLTPTIGLGCR